MKRAVNYVDISCRVSSPSILCTNILLLPEMRIFPLFSGFYETNYFPLERHLRLSQKMSREGSKVVKR